MEEAALPQLIQELQDQLDEQRTSLQTIQAALVLEPGDSQLQSLQQELVQAIHSLQDTLEGLGHTQPQPAVEQHGPPEPGTPCRFRYTDGRWYYGQVSGPHPSGALVAWAHPTKPFMLQPAAVPVSLIVPTPAPQPLESVSIGARLLARDPSSSLWRPAEVSHVTAGSSCCTVVFVHSHVEARGMPLWHLATSAHAPAADTEAWEAPQEAQQAGDGEDRTVGGHGSPSSDSDTMNSWDGSSMSISDSGDEDASSSSSGAGASDIERSDAEAAGAQAGRGCVLLHAQDAAAAGIQTDTALFAGWEQHSRGIASKLLARWGHTRGRGLGKRGGGRVDPLPLVALPPRRGLGASKQHRQKHRHKGDKRRHSTAVEGGDGSSKPRTSRGGQRSRLRKAAAAARAAKEQAKDQQQHELDAGTPGVFAFLNKQLVGLTQEEVGTSAAGNTSSGQQQSSLWHNSPASAAAAAAAARGGPSSSMPAAKRQGGASGRPATAAAASRSGLVARQDQLQALQDRIKQLEAQLARNKADRLLAPQIAAKLRAAQAQLAAGQAEAARHRQLLNHKEAATKMAKF